jgi:putative flippase GtrA
VARLALQTSVARFFCIGVASTVAYAVLYLMLQGLLGAAGANALALALTAVANTAANRRLTFRIRGRARLLRHHAMGALVYVLTLGLTMGALAVLHGVVTHPAPGLELAVLVVAGLVATMTRYVALKTWVFARRRGRGLGAATAVPDRTTGC